MVQDPGRTLEPVFLPGLGDVTASLVCQYWSSTCIGSCALLPGAWLCHPPGAQHRGGRSSGQSSEKEVGRCFPEVTVARAETGQLWSKQGEQLWRHILGCQGVRQELAYGRAAGKVVVSGELRAAGGFAVQLPGRVDWALPLAGQLLGGGTVTLKLC